jgi:hypothetical protein
MKLHFLPIFEYDPTKDAHKVLGYPKDNGKIIPSLVCVYKWSTDEEGRQIWHKLRGKQWRLSVPPASFCDVPRCEFVKFRKPTKEKIASLNVAEAMQYVKRSEELQDRVTEFIKMELTKQFYEE